MSLEHYLQQFLLGLLLGTMFLANLMAGGGGRKRRRRKRDVVQGEDMAFTKIIKGIRRQSAWEKKLKRNYCVFLIGLEESAAKWG